MSSKTLPFAITLDPGTSLANETGSWRTERPVYLDRLPPCNNACPAGENIQQWLFHAESGDYHAAWQKLMEDNPLPGVMGRVCYHPCEDACNRAQLDEAVGIPRSSVSSAARPGNTAGRQNSMRRRPASAC
jgi:NADPH-dependent glutamate synthase beta subunit-like oxidoreductase